MPPLLSSPTISIVGRRRVYACDRRLVEDDKNFLAAPRDGDFYINSNVIPLCYCMLFGRIFAFYWRWFPECVTGGRTRCANKIDAAHQGAKIGAIGHG